MNDIDPKKIIEAIKAAERNLQIAKNLLSGKLENATGENFLKSQIDSVSDPIIDENTRIIEGIFDGQNMIDKNGRTHPVPTNYASKSKLVVGDQLKLTITEGGKFIYKQIGPVARKSFVGPLSYENGQYSVLTNNRVYKVLLASVTFFRVEIGNEVSILIPEKNEDCEWGAIDAVIPKFE